MDDIGGIIFYIIAAIIGLVTTLGKKKKKAAKSAPPQDEAIDTQDPEVLVEKEIDPLVERFRRDDVLVSEPIIESFTFNSKFEEKYEDVMVADSESPVESILSKDDLSKMDEEIVDVIAEEEISEVGEIVADFDLKQAIIFSEILNRKDY